MLILFFSMVFQQKHSRFLSEKEIIKIKVTVCSCSNHLFKNKRQNPNNQIILLFPIILTRKLNLLLRLESCILILYLVPCARPNDGGSSNFSARMFSRAGLAPYTSRFMISSSIFRNKWIGLYTLQSVISISST
jgi:hypothetical protein